MGSNMRTIFRICMLSLLLLIIWPANIFAPPRLRQSAVNSESENTAESGFESTNSLRSETSFFNFPIIIPTMPSFRWLKSFLGFRSFDSDSGDVSDVSVYGSSYHTNTDQYSTSTSSLPSPSTPPPHHESIPPPSAKHTHQPENQYKPSPRFSLKKETGSSDPAEKEQSSRNPRLQTDTIKITTTTASTTPTAVTTLPTTTITSSTIAETTSTTSSTPITTTPSTSTTATIPTVPIAVDIDISIGVGGENYVEQKYENSEDATNAGLDHEEDVTSNENDASDKSDNNLDIAPENDKTSLQIDEIKETLEYATEKVENESKEESKIE